MTFSSRHFGRMLQKWRENDSPEQMALSCAAGAGGVAFYIFEAVGIFLARADDVIWRLSDTVMLFRNQMRLARADK